MNRASMSGTTAPMEGEQKQSGIAANGSSTFLCPACGKRLPVESMKLTGSLSVYCRHCGKMVRISIEAA
jgi:transcription elongation factor Elf1